MMNMAHDDDDDGGSDEDNLSLQPSIGSNYEARRPMLAPVAGAFTCECNHQHQHHHHHHPYHDHHHHDHHHDTHCGWLSRPCAGGRRGGGTLDVGLLAKGGGPENFEN